MAILKDTTINGSPALNVDFMKKYFGKDTPPMTTLYNGNAGGGNIALLDDWTSYDMLVVQITNDSRGNVSTYYYPVWNLRLGIDLMNSTGKEGVDLAWGTCYWIIKKSSTGTNLIVSTENSCIEKIYGIKFE